MKAERLGAKGGWSAAEAVRNFDAGMGAVPRVCMLQPLLPASWALRVQHLQILEVGGAARGGASAQSWCSDLQANVADCLQGQIRDGRCTVLCRAAGAGGAEASAEFVAGASLRAEWRLS